MMGTLKESIFGASGTLTANIQTRFLPKIPDIVGDVSGWTIIVTGPTSGVGLATTRQLVAGGADVVLAVRNVPKGEELKSSLEEDARSAGRTPPQITVEELDVSSLGSVRGFAHRWRVSGRPLDVLINNAGISDMQSKTPVLTSEGHERHLATNYLGPALLSRLLLPSLLRTAEQTRRTPRVVHVTSILHIFGRVRKEDPNLVGPRAYGQLAAYAQSKLLQILFSWELQRRSHGKLLSIAVHPGSVKTDLFRNASGPSRLFLSLREAIISMPTEQGARSTLFAATSPEVLSWVAETDAPVYLHWNAKRHTPSEAARDPAMAAWVWEWTSETTGVPTDLDAPLGDHEW